VIDYHVHLWRHEPHLSLQATVEQLADYCARAAEVGVRELAVTEHTSRFAQFDALVRGWWDSDPNPALRAEAADVIKVAGHRPAAPDEFYDRIAEAARSCGLAAELNSSGWRRPCAEAYPAPSCWARATPTWPTSYGTVAKSGLWTSKTPDAARRCRKPFELALLVEHVSAWRDARLSAETVIARFDLSQAEKARLREFRRLAALFWLEKLRTRTPARSLNTPEIACDQAQRVLALLQGDP
jgi:hypothetical protein